RLEQSILAAAPGGVAVDPNTLAVVTARSLQQPEFVAAFAGALDEVQTHVVNGVGGPITLDPVLVTEAVRNASADQPQFAAALATSPPLVIQVPDDKVPDLSRWANLWQAAVRVLAFLSLVLITYGMLKVEHRTWAIGRVGRWAIVVGLTTLTLFWLLPRALLDPLGGWIAVGGAVLDSGDVLIPISLVLVAVGGATVIGAHRWETHDRDRVLSVIPHAPTRSPGGASPWESPV
ncbi:MAG: hypothetical protein ACXVKQ_07670, partial [Acidimicrobiia bacterium]